MATDEEIRAKDVVPKLTEFREGDGLYGDGQTSFFMEHHDIAKNVVKDSAENTAATEADMVAGSKIPIMTAAGPKALPGNAVAKASDVVALQTKTTNISASIAPNFDPTRTNANPYLAGTPVMYNNTLYRFKVDHYGAWSSNDVFAVSSASCRLVHFKPVVLDEMPSETDVTYETGVLKKDGTISAISGFHTSDYILVDVSKTYQVRLTSFGSDYFQICLYDANKNLIGGINEGATSTEVALEFSSDVKYFRVSNGSTLMVKERVATASVFFDTSIDFPLELLDSTRLKTNYYIGSSGGEVSFNGATASDYIPVTVGTSYTIRDSFGGSTAKTAFYDKAKKFISAVNSETTTVTAPSNAKYMRVSLRTAYISTASVCKGTQPLPSIAIPYGQTQFEIVNTLFVPAPYVQLEMFEFNKDVTFVDGVFEQSSSSNFKTSDYVNIVTTGNAASEFFFILRSIYSASYDMVRFYDKDKNVIAAVKGGSEDDVGIKTNQIYKVVAPKNAVYMKYSQGSNVISNSTGGLATLKFDAAPDYLRPVYFAETNNLIWIGTSIPEGAKYPSEASKACRYNCLNKSLGSSMLRFTGVHPQTVEEWSGKCLTATVDELEALYRQDVTDGIITEERLNQWKSYSYENSIIPYIDGTDDFQASAIVLDHGFNDRANIHTLMQNPSSIDWTSTDRSNFVGAFNYLYFNIIEANPFVKVIISGYFQDIYDGYYSKDICDMQQLIAEKYDLPLMPTWKYSGINFEYVPGSSDYISNFNSTYETSYTKMNPDGNGNIPLFQFFCPDKVHPHSDKTGNCNRRLNAVYMKMLRDSL